MSYQLMKTYIDDLVTAGEIEYGTITGENIDGTGRATVGILQYGSIYEKEVFLKSTIDGYTHTFIQKQAAVPGVESMDLQTLYDKIEELENKLKNITMLMTEGLPKSSSVINSYKVDKTNIIIDAWKEFIINNPEIVDDKIKDGLTNLLVNNSNLTEIQIENKNIVQKWINKLKARFRIEAEVGDIYDLVADLSKRIAITERFTMRHFLDYVGEYAMNSTFKATYAYIMKPQIEDVDSGKAIDRSDLQDSSEMITELESRRTKIKDAVKEEMIDKE